MSSQVSSGNYISFLRDNIPTEYVDRLDSIINNHQVKTLQTLLNIRLGEESQLIEDGIIGFNTMIAIMNNIEVLEEVFNDMSSIVEPISDEEKAILDIRKFLQENEGTTCHYLKGEHGFTTPYGTYSVANPNSKPVLLMKRLYIKYGLDYKIREHAYILDKKITIEERQKLMDLSLELFIQKYLGSMFVLLLRYRSSLLSFFSNSVNAGKPRATKLLQSVVGTKADGVAGIMTSRAIKKFLKDYGDRTLSLGMLDRMANFYCGLITNRPNRYGRFKNGWLNRIRSIGYTRSSLC